jgi:hypothetical protein
MQGDEDETYRERGREKENGLGRYSRKQKNQVKVSIYTTKT